MLHLTPMGPTIVFMYSGQGSQFYHMGKTLYEQQPVFRSCMEQMDRQVIRLTGRSVLEELYDPRKTVGRPFQQTLYTHPAIFMVEHACTRLLLEHGIAPDMVLGSSLGEFAAAVTAGVWDAEEGLQAVVEQARLLEACCGEGGMLAVLHSLAVYQADAHIGNNCELASVNHEEHFVVAGSSSGLAAVEQAFKAKGMIAQRLPVTQGFHSSAIDPAEKAYKAFLKHKGLNTPGIRFVSSLYGKEVQKLAPDYFWRVIREPIRFAEAAAYVNSLEEDCVYIDVGPSGTLANLLKKINGGDRSVSAHSIITPFHQDGKNVEKLVSQYKATGEKPMAKKELKRMLAYVFPGQGSQKKGMGGDLFERFPDITRQADEILGYSIRELCLNNPSNQLEQTQYTQPALYTVNALLYLDAVQQTGLKPDIVAGHSLGEYNALLAAGAFDFATGLKLVQKRGELMSQAHGGGMAAVVGLEEKQVQMTIERHLDFIDIANYNTPKQFVISGRKEDIESAKPIFEAIEGATYIPLRVSGAFHSRYMSEAQKLFQAELQRAEFSALQIPVLANISARPYRFEEIGVNLLKQITHSVKWSETIRVLMGFDNMEIKEIGPGTVLTGLTAKIVQDAEQIRIVLDPQTAVDEAAAGAELQAEIEPELQLEETVQSAAAMEQEPEVELQREMLSEREALAGFSAESLGCGEFKRDYQLKYAYMTGAMFMGISSRELVVRMGQAGMMGILGTGGLSLGQTEEAIRYIQRELAHGQAYGVNLLHDPQNPEREEQLVDLYLKLGVRTVEASSYISITPALIKYRARGLVRSGNGTVTAQNRIIAKVSRPEVAESFLSPALEYMVDKMVEQRSITRAEADMLKALPMADDLCLEADSGGNTDGGNGYVLMPAIKKLRDDMMAKHGFARKVRVGAAGGIGTPEAAAAAFVMGADFIATGSINQCTVEAGTSVLVKDLLQQINIQDTVYAPGGDLFEWGTQIQVLKKGTFFPARARKLHELYQRHNSLDELDEKDKKQLQDKYFKRSFQDIYAELKGSLPQHEIGKAEANPKRKMALIFKWYYTYSARIALEGDHDRQVDFQVHCGPALGAFNRWVEGTPLEAWRSRHCDEIGIKLMKETAVLLRKNMQRILFAIGG